MEDYIQITILGDVWAILLQIEQQRMNYINGNILKFTIDFDQTEIHELNIILKK